MADLAKIISEDSKRVGLVLTLSEMNIRSSSVKILQYHKNASVCPSLEEVLRSTVNNRGENKGFSKLLLIST